MWWMKFMQGEMFIIKINISSCDVLGNFYLDLTETSTMKIVYTSPCGSREWWDIGKCESVGLGL